MPWLGAFRPREAKLEAGMARRCLRRCSAFHRTSRGRFVFEKFGDKFGLLQAAGMHVSSPVVRAQSGRPRMSYRELDSCSARADQRAPARCSVDRPTLSSQESSHSSSPDPGGPGLD